jgi:predicted nucleic acid-binding protein
MAYVDTSVLVACYCPEPLSDAAARAVRRAGRPTVSPLVELEFCAAAAAKVRRGELGKDAARRMIALLRRHLSDGRYGIVPVGGREYGLARDWIGRFAASLRAADALHLAAASNNDLTLLTADKDLARAAEAFGASHKLIA